MNSNTTPATWQSGRESHLLDAIIAGHKTVEGRLNRGKFAKYRVGDTISLRRDWRDTEGVLHDGEPNVARVKIVGIRHYPTFLAMVQAEGWQRVIPSAESDEAAAAEYTHYYSPREQAAYGVLAIEVRVVVSA